MGRLKNLGRGKFYPHKSSGIIIEIIAAVTRMMMI